MSKHTKAQPHHTASALPDLLKATGAASVEPSPLSLSIHASSHMCTAQLLYNNFCLLLGCFPRPSPQLCSTRFSATTGTAHQIIGETNSAK
jgi:hypothetical protein